MEVVCALRLGRALDSVQGVCNPTTKKRSLIYAHRKILNAPDGVVVDHINGDTLDNRRSNIRLCSAAENSRNRRMRRRNRSGFKGVVRRGNRWEVRIQLNSKQYFLGSFSDISDAVRAYDLASVQMHGEFASPNFTRN